MNIVWTALIVIFVFLELITTALVTIWFAIGAFAALIASLLNANEYIQAFVFVGVSLVSLILTRPILMKLKTSTDSELNTIVGKKATVKQKQQDSEQGIVTCEGKLWKYTCDEELNVGDEVVITGIKDLIVSVTKEEK